MAPIIVTLGMMQVIRGASKWLAGQEMVRTPDNALQHWMDPVPQWTGIFFAPGVWLALILCVMLGRVLKVSVWGRFLYAMGGNRKTAAACGVDVSQMTKTVYGVAGTLFGIAGIMQYASLGSGSPSEAVGLELDIIAAVVIGGGTLGGGRGSATGAMMGAVTMSVLRSGCAMLGVPSFVQEIMIGLVIIAAIGGDQLKRRVWADHSSVT
jgi:ribose transport system permease protein